LIGCGATAQLYYTQRSLGTTAGGFVEILSASSSGLTSQLVSLRNKQHGAWLSDGSNVALAKIEALYLDRLYFSIKDPFSGIIVPSETILRARIGQFDPFFIAFGRPLASLEKQLAADFPMLTFDMHGALPSANEFHMQREIVDSAGMTVIESSKELGVVNRRGGFGNAEDGHIVKLAVEPKNYLLFVSSRFGLPAWPQTSMSDRIAGLVSMYQPEADFFFKGRTMVSLGRDCLFRILNSSPKPRMIIEYTASLKSDRENRVPVPSVIGDARYMIPAEGRGSARLFSPPIRPQEVDGGKYVALDMGSWGGFFPTHKRGFMRLYGSDISADSRRIVGFARDISMISETEYAAMRPPSAIRRFPDDLKNQDLEYSGIYEDGWIAESSYMILAQTSDGSVLVISANVPELQGHLASSSVTLVVDGDEVARKTIASGAVSFQVRLKGTGNRRIELLFDRANSLPNPDGRPVSALLRYVGFQHSAPALTEKEPMRK
jgi:hypothetical protein